MHDYFSQFFDADGHLVRTIEGEHSVIFKHSMSGAKDAATRFSIDRDRQIVFIDQMTYRGRTFLSSGLLIDLARWIEHKHDIVIYNNDDVDSFQPERTAWRVLAYCGEQGFNVELWKQRGGQWCVEFHPYPPAPASEPAS